MSPWYTRPVRIAPPQAVEGKLAPSLLYHKWHAYDSPSLEHKEARPEFLRMVLKAVESARTGPSGKAYGTWLARYNQALRGAAGEHLATFEAKTVWRLAVGMATNPALETGLTFHPLLGFPYLPGSAVKGLAHHLAEVELLTDQEEWVEDEQAPGLPDEATLLDLIAKAELVKALFGSLHLLPREPSARPRTARSLLESWAKDSAFPHGLLLRTRRLLEDTGGLLAFYDAVPAADAKDLLQLDVITPHYPKYYQNKGTVPPSDDQDPTPIPFLAVRPGAKLCFAFRLGALPRREARVKEEEERARVLLAGMSREDLLRKVKSWLTRGLGELGAGAKTAAGYGYFKEVQASP